MKSLKPKFSSKNDFTTVKESNSESDRSWTVEDFDISEIKKDELFSNLKIEIITRDDTETKNNTIQEIFYSSLRYKLDAKVPSSCFNKDIGIIAKLELVYSDNSKELVVSNDIGNQSVIDIPEFLSSKKLKDNYVIASKLKVNCVSYHFKRKSFCFRFSLFYISDTTNPLIILLSAPFMVYSRRKNFSKKRKRDHPPETINVSLQKPEIPRNSEKSVGEKIEEKIIDFEINQIAPPQKKRKLNDLSEQELSASTTSSTSSENNEIMNRNMTHQQENYKFLIDRLSDIKKTLEFEKQMELVEYAREKLEIPNTLDFDDPTYSNDDADWFQTPIVDEEDKLFQDKDLSIDFFHMDF